LTPDDTGAIGFQDLRSSFKFLSDLTTSGVIPVFYILTPDDTGAIGFQDLRSSTKRINRVGE
jgi:hypothetical protein